LALVTSISFVCWKTTFVENVSLLLTSMSMLVEDISRNKCFSSIGLIWLRIGTSGGLLWTP
jgi:hypothetical protein